MARPRNLWMSVALALSLALSVLFALPQVARAEWIYRGDTIPVGQTVENDVIITGTNITVDGAVNGDVVAIGSNITVNGSVRGSLVAVGRTVTVNGDVGSSVYAVARTLKLGPSSYVQNNLHFLGILLDSQSGSKIGRDLVAAAVRARIATEIGRGLNAIVALMSFNGKIGYGLEQPEIGTPPSGAWNPAQPGATDLLLFVSAGTRSLAGYSAPARASLFPLLIQDEPGGRGLPIAEWIVARLGELFTLLLVGGLALWLLPSWFGRWVGRLRGKPLPALGYGLLALIVSVNGVGVAILLGVMLVTAGIWLGSVTLWTLAFLFWGVGFSLLVLVVSLIALAVVFGSKVIVSYLVASLILERLWPRAARYRAVILLLGVILYILLRSIPTIGWIIEVIIIVFGLGAIWLGFRRQEAPEVQPAAESE